MAVRWAGRFARWLLLVVVVTMAVWIVREPLLRSLGRLFFPFPYRSIVEAAARQARVDPLLVVTVMREESKFVPAACSRAGALGLMQLMPHTAHWLAKKFQLSARDLTDPETNIRLGTAYLGYLKGQFRGEVTLVLAAYNGGEGNLSRWESLSQAFPETQNYVKRSLRTYSIYRWLYGIEYSQQRIEPAITKPQENSVNGGN